MTKYRRLEKGELIQEGDEIDDCVDSWRDDPVWNPVNPKSYGRPAPDPQFPAHRQYRRPIAEDAYSLPTGYAETMDKLKDSERWDIPGVIASIAEGLRRESDNGAALAVIDTLCFRMRDIAERISHRYAKRIDPSTIREAAEIAASFVDTPSE